MRMHYMRAFNLTVSGAQKFDTQFRVLYFSGKVEGEGWVRREGGTSVINEIHSLFER